jgi:hypothetical protein
VPSFWQVPLFGDCPGSYRTLLRKPPDLVSTEAKPAAKDAELAGQTAASAGRPRPRPRDEGAGP